MVTPLLTTKLYTPPVRSELVRRPRLIERLNAGLHHKLILISAPAGFGKTTLLSHWISEFGVGTSNFGARASCAPPVYDSTSTVRGRPEIRGRAAWLSLDEGDNDPARFVAYIVAALQTAESETGEGVLSALQAPPIAGATAPLPMEPVLTMLINEMASISGSLVLVLDDYHVIKAQPVHDVVIYLLDHLPHQVHLAIASRADPALPIARLRGRGQLTELRLTDLRFTPAEVSQFLGRTVGLELSAKDIASLAARTEGWIAGLQLAALSMRGRDDVSGFIAAFTGSNRYILDYLLEEVLYRESEHIQTFLLQTSILERLCGSLCDAVIDEGRWIEDARLSSVVGDSGQNASGTGPHCRSSSSQHVLERLERSNLFVVPLDDRREWYRYHRLFADLLRQRLYQMQPDLVPALHCRASGWYERCNLMAWAIDHALSGRDFERGARLVEEAAEATLMRSEVATLLRWLEALPDEQIRARPTLCIMHAWALVLAGRPTAEVESRLQDVAVDTDLISGRIAPVKAFVAILQGQFSQAGDMARQALDQLREDDSYLRHIAAWLLGVSQVADGDVVAGSRALDDIARASQETGNVMISVFALRHRARLQAREGRLHKAKALYEKALDLASHRADAYRAGNQERTLPIAGQALIGLGELAREWNNLEAAARYLTEGIELTRRWREIASLSGYISLARVKQAQGCTEEADSTIQKARQLAMRFDAVEWDDHIAAMVQTQLWIAQSKDDPSRLEAAVRWAEERGLVPGNVEGPDELGGDQTTIDGHLRKYEHLVLARLLLAQDRPDEALAVLDPLLPAMERQRRIKTVIEVQVLRALAFRAQGDLAQAMSALERALYLAEPGGYVRIFLDEGEAMGGLLRQAADGGIAADYVGKLLTAIGSESPRLEVDRPHMQAPTSQLGATIPETSLVEPLSERELEVLRLLTTHFSSTGIAGELFISVNTVRSHVRSIYSKLGVHSRYEAIARAKQLGLL